MRFEVVFQPSGKRVSVQEGMTILAAAREAGEDIRSECGGMEKCGKCTVLVDGEEIRACDTVVDHDITVEVPEESREHKQVILHEGSGVMVELDPPGLDSVGEIHGPIYGLAMDVGTTTVVGYLVDLTTGKTAATSSLMNPQIRFGEDVMARISHAMKDGVEGLHDSIIGGLNEIMEGALKEAGVAKENIIDVTAVGNTVMHHMFLGLDPSSLGVSPFKPVLKEAFDTKAHDIGLDVPPGTNLHVLPNIEGFIGADNVGALIATEIYKSHEMTLLMDIGTNGEIVLGNREGLLAASCATGPALEGGHIKDGMRAAPGAIEHLDIDPRSKEVNLQVIGGGKPGGICGSGVVDTVAEMLTSGILKADGGFVEGSRGVRTGEDGMEFVVAGGEETAHGRDILFTKKDVSEVQLAKAALMAGTKILLKKAGIDKPDRLILAGAFGSRIRKESAVRIGIFPELENEKIRVVGNAAGDGARLALLSRKKREEAKQIADQVDYVELTLEPDFEDEFVRSLGF